jgi:hypothetical protein
MEHYEYYNELAESIFFRGISASEVPQIAKYRKGKSFQDIKTAVQEGLRQSAGRPAEAAFGNLAQKLFDVVEIDASEPLQKYIERLKAVSDSEPARTV